MSERKPSPNEAIKRESRGLRGTIAEELADGTKGDVSDPAYELLKFHGTYLQYDRDTATGRKQRGQDKEWQFMLRMKLPGGRLSAEQYLALDGLADTYSNGSLRITTRQTFQFHCVLKENLKAHIAAINRLMLSTLAACGDVVRNVVTCPAPIKDAPHELMQQAALSIARELAPKTSGYHELWLDGEKLERPFDADDAGSLPPDGIDPLYGETYLPRKFKIGIAPEWDNCVDVLTNDLAILPHFEGNALKGYTFALGGGLGMTHNKPDTYPRLATPIAFVKPADLIPAAKAVVTLQRDNGDRCNRKHARLKYVVEEKGADWVFENLQKHFGRGLERASQLGKFTIEDHMDWHPQGDGKWFVGIPVPSGRVMDMPGEAIRSGLREVIAQYKMPLRLTLDQNILLCDIEEGEKPAVEKILHKHGVRLAGQYTPLSRFALACVSYPTCGLALAEAERIQRPLVEEFERLLGKLGLVEEKLSLRIAGCPNGCSRPYVGDIGLVGRMPGHYALFVGGDFEGTRLNAKLFDRVPYEHIATALEPMLALFKQKREAGEGFGDFCARVGVGHVKQAAVAVAAPQHKWAV